MNLRLSGTACAVSCLFSFPSVADTGISLVFADTLTTPVKTGERLSEWLVRAAGSSPDVTALHCVSSHRSPSSACCETLPWPI